MFIEYFFPALVVLFIFAAFSVYDWFQDGELPCRTNTTMAIVIAFVPVVNYLVAGALVIVLAAYFIIKGFLKVFG